MGIETIVSIIGGILAIVSGIFGKKWFDAKKVARNIVDIADTVVNAVEDDKVTDEEVKDIVKESKGVLKSERKKVNK